MSFMEKSYWSNHTRRNSPLLNGNLPSGMLCGSQRGDTTACLRLWTLYKGCISMELLTCVSSLWPPRAQARDLHLRVGSIVSCPVTRITASNLISSFLVLTTDMHKGMMRRGSALYLQSLMKINMKVFRGGLKPPLAKAPVKILAGSSTSNVLGGNT